MFDLCTKTDLKLDSHSKTLRGSIFDVIDQKVGSEGGIKSVVLAKSLGQLKDELFRRIDALGECSRTPPPYKKNTPCLLLREMFRGRDLFSFYYKGSSRYIPESFEFPWNTTRLAGWWKWLRGSVHVEGGQRWKIKLS